MGTHSINAGGLSGWNLCQWKCFSLLLFCVWGRWMTERKMYSLRRGESASVKFSKGSKFISESPISSWPPRGRWTRFAQSSTHHSWETTWLWTTLSLWNEAGQAEGLKRHIRNSEWWNTLGTKNFVTVDHTDANCVILIFSNCEAPKWKSVEACVQERCADDSLRGPRLILFFFFAFLFILLSSNKVKV